MPVLCLQKVNITASFARDNATKLEYKEKHSSAAIQCRAAESKDWSVMSSVSSSEAIILIFVWLSASFLTE